MPAGYPISFLGRVGRIVRQSENSYEFPLSMKPQPPVGQGLLIIEVSRSHSDTPHSVEILWMRDQADEENST
jgi:hypothetical protein